MKVRKVLLFVSVILSAFIDFLTSFPAEKRSNHVGTVTGGYTLF